MQILPFSEGHHSLTQTQLYQPPRSWLLLLPSLRKQLFALGPLLPSPRSLISCLWYPAKEQCAQLTSGRTEERCQKKTYTSFQKKFLFPEKDGIFCLAPPPRPTQPLGTGLALPAPVLVAGAHRDRSGQLCDERSACFTRDVHEPSRCAQTAHSNTHKAWEVCLYFRLCSCSSAP